MPNQQEVYGNDAQATITAGGTDAPAAGTTETWTATGITGMPAANPTLVPPAVFYIADTASGAETEKMLVTDNRTSNWSVTRGADSTTPVAHSVPFTVQQVVPAGSASRWSAAFLHSQSHWNAVNAFGADPTGVNDSTAAIQNAISEGIGYIPGGTFKLTSGLTVSSNQRVRGDGPGATVLVPASNYGDVFTFPAGTSYAGITDLGITYTGQTTSSTSTPSTHAGVKFTVATTVPQFGLYIDLVNLAFTGMGQAVFTPWTSGTSLNYSQYYYLLMRRLFIFNGNIGLLLNGFSDSRIENVLCSSMFGQNVSSLQSHCAPPASDITPAPAYSATCQNWINDLGNSTIDKLEIYGGKGDGVAFQDCVTTHIRDCESGSLLGNGVTVIGCTLQFVLDGLHCGLNSGAGVYITTDASGGSGVSGVTMIGCQIDNNGHQGINFSPQSGYPASNLDLVGCEVFNNSSPAAIGGSGGPANTYDGVDFAGSDLRITGGNYTGGALQRYGVNATASGVNNVTIVGADLSGNVSAPISANWGSTPLVTGCRGANYQGFSTGTPTVPGGIGSGFKQINPNPYDVVIYLNGQQGTHIIDRNQTTPTDKALPKDPDQVTLHPGEYIYFAGMVPSSWLWYGV